MLYLVIFIFLVLVITGLLYLLNIYIKFHYIADEKGDHISVTVYALKGFLKFKREIGPKGIKKPGTKEADKTEDKKRRGMLEIYDKYAHFRTFYGATVKLREYIEEKIHLEEVKIDASIGTGDACLTGITAGLAWAFAGVLVSFLTQKFNSFKKDIRIVPFFSEKKLKLDLYSIFKTKLVHIIVVGLKYLSITIKEKIKKGKEKNYNPKSGNKKS